MKGPANDTVVGENAQPQDKDQFKNSLLPRLRFGFRCVTISIINPGSEP